MGSPYASFEKMTFRGTAAAEESAMRRNDLMKSDLLSEIVLLSTSVSILLTLIVVFAVVVTHTSTLP